MTGTVMAASFEDRCLALPASLPAAGADHRALVIDFAGYEDVAPYLFNRREMLVTLERKGYNVKRVPAEITRPLEGTEHVRRALTGVDDVLLDISAMPRNYLFCLCRILADRATPTRIRYYRPKDYGSELSRGVRAVEAVPGFEGDIASTGETVLALILGFEGYKALHAWEKIGPSRTIALFGDPPYEPAFGLISRENNRELIEQAGSVTEIPLHTLDVMSAKAQLNAIYLETKTRDPGVGFIVCPLGTKPQSLAAFALAYEHKDVALAYVSSRSYYTTEYTRGWRDDFLEIPLTDLLGNL
jgi:hypothetical protein